MKRIEGIIQPHRLSKVVTALHALPRFPGFTTFGAHGQGRGRGRGGHFAYGHESGLMYHERCILVVICADIEADAIAQIISQTAHTGRPGDGIVSISAVENVHRVRQSAGES